MQIHQKKLKSGEARKKTLFWSLACLLLLVTSFYVYFVNTAALHAFRLGRAAEARSGLQARISELEEGYLSRKQNVTLSLAYRAGFEDARAIRFLERKSVGVLPRHNDL